MSVWFDKSVGHWKIRIRRRGQEVARTLQSGITRSQAEELHTKLLREFFDQAELGRQNYSIADALNRLIEDELPHLKTAHHVMSNIKALLDHVEGRSLADAADVAASYARLQSGKLAAATINRRLAVLRRATNLAWKSWGWLPRPVAIRLLPEHNERHFYLERGEIELLAWFAEAWIPLAGDMVLIGAYTGMRQGEIVAMRKDWIANKTIYIPTSKTGEPRAVPVVPRISKVITRWCKTEKPGTRWLYRGFERAKAAILRPELRFHDLRHTTASLLINAGVPLYTVGRILGHADPRTTQRYSHLDLESLRAAMGRIAPRRKRASHK